MNRLQIANAIDVRTRATRVTLSARLSPYDMDVLLAPEASAPLTAWASVR